MDPKEIDWLIAEEVLDVAVDYEVGPNPYSTSLYFAQKVIDNLKRRGLVLRICINFEDVDCFVIREGYKTGYGKSDTLEMAICKAALDHVLYYE